MAKLKKYQKKITRENNMISPIEHRLLDTLSELGEVEKEVLLMSNYGRKKSKYREELKSELGDTLYSLITVGNTYDIDLEKALEAVLEKYEKRLEKGSAGSGNT